MNHTHPFLFGGAISGEWFTDRETDTLRLSKNFENGINTILISPRRWGKTSLVNTVIEQKTSSYLSVRIDIFACKTEADFYQLFATEVIKQTSSKWEEWTANVQQFLTSLKPTISMGTDPLTDFNLSFSIESRQMGEELLNLPLKIAQKKKKNMVICIDEFQQIASFTDSLTFQKKLRTSWQHHSGTVSYCLYGSKKHLMSTLFTTQSMPFYRFGDLIYLPKISEAHWIPYIQSRFEMTGKHISEKLARQICTTVDNHSSYVQQLAWLVWLRTEDTVSELIFEEALADILEQNAILYQHYAEGLSSLQINFLRAVANGIKDSYSTQEIIRKYQLGSSANVARLKASLEQKELIDLYPHSITFNDPVFCIWFRQKFM